MGTAYSTEPPSTASFTTNASVSSPWRVASSFDGKASVVVVPATYACPAGSTATARPDSGHRRR
jgi:hypothetical protein